MIPEYIYDHDSYDGSEGLIAIILRNGLEAKQQESTLFVTPPYLPQQVAMLNHKALMVIPPHYHPLRKREIQHTQEVLIVRKGVARLRLFNTKADPIKEIDLQAGDIAVLVAGGHGITFLQDTEMVEVKQGPYAGKDQDKILLHLK